MQKIIVVGGTGTIGREVVNVLSERHEVIPFEKNKFINLIDEIV